MSGTGVEIWRLEFAHQSSTSAWVEEYRTAGANFDEAYETAKARARADNPYGNSRMVGAELLAETNA